MDQPGPRPRVLLTDKGYHADFILADLEARGVVANAEVWLFQDGDPVSVSNLTLMVEKVGFERNVYEFAHRQPWLYGVVCVPSPRASLHRPSWDWFVR